METLKSAVGAATTTSGGAPLAQSLIGEEIFTLLQTASIFGRLSRDFRRVPFRTKFPRELGAGAGGAWSGEGLPRPVVKTSFDAIELDYFSIDAIIVLTKEAFRFGVVSEAALRAAVIAGLARYLDAQLLDPTVSAAATHPASLTNNAVAVTSTGSTAAQIIADLTAMIAAITSPGDALRWIMRPLTYATINGRLAGVGYPTVPGSLFGIPVIAGSTSPQQVALIDVAAVATAFDGSVSIDATGQADVEMVDGGSSQNGTTGVGVSMVSLYQCNLIAVRAGIPVNWEHTAFPVGSPSQAAGASVMAVSY